MILEEMAKAFVGGFCVTLLFCIGCVVYWAVSGSSEDKESEQPTKKESRQRTKRKNGQATRRKSGQGTRRKALQ